MTCAELRDRLDAYAREALPGEEVAALEAHLSGCESCSGFLESLAPRLPEIAALPRTIEPPSAVWREVRSRIGARRPGARHVRVPTWVLAAAAVLLVAISAGATALLLRRPAGTAPASAVSASSLEAQYASASADLAGELAKAKGLLAPATVAVIERNLRVIDSALAESRRALQADPRNRALEQILVAVWRQKIDYLRRATALSPAS